MSGRGRPPGRGHNNNKASPHVGGSGARGTRGTPASSPRSASAASKSRSVSMPSLLPASQQHQSAPSSSAVTPTSIPIKRRPSSEGKGKKLRRPKFTDNPPAPEIREKLELDPDEFSEAILGEMKASADCDKSEAANGHVEDEDDCSEAKKRRLDDGDVSAEAKKRRGDVDVEVSGLVSDLVKRMDSSEVPESDSIEDMIANSTLVIKEDEMEAEDVHSTSEAGRDGAAADSSGKTLTQSLRDNLTKAVKRSDEAEPRPINDLLRTMKEAFKSAVATSGSTAAQAAAAAADDTAADSVKVIMEEFLAEGETTVTSSGGESKAQLVQNLLSELKSGEDDDVLDVILPLDEVEGGMVPVDSVEIEDMSESSPIIVSVESLAAADSTSASSSPKTKPVFDKSKLFSHMENKFAKDTHNALKNRPTNKRRSAMSDQEAAAPTPKPSSGSNNQTAAADSSSSKVATKAAESDNNAEEESSRDSQVLQSPPPVLSDSNQINPLRRVRAVKRLRTTSSTAGGAVSDESAADEDSHLSESARNGSQDVPVPVPIPVAVVASSPTKLILKSPGKKEGSPIEVPLKIDIPVLNSMTDDEDDDDEEEEVDDVEPNDVSMTNSRGSLLTTRPAVVVPIRQSPTKTMPVRPSLVSDRRITGNGVGRSSARSNGRRHVSFNVTMSIHDIDLALKSLSPRGQNHHVNGEQPEGGSLRTVIRLPPKNNKPPPRKPARHETSDGEDDFEDTSLDVLSVVGRKRARARSGVSPLGVITMSPIPTSSREDIDMRTSPEALMMDSARAMSTSPDGAFSSAVSGKQTPDSSKSDEKLAASMVVPEKASSFNIHPERCCSNDCFYCGMKFGTLDTPQHLLQLKSTAVQQMAADLASVAVDACLCDKCYRYFDRQAKSKIAQNKAGLYGLDCSKMGDQSKFDRTRLCIVKNCIREVTSNVSRKWLMRLRRRLEREKRMHVSWERVNKGSAKATFGICHKHNAVMEACSLCGLCKCKLSVSGISFISGKDDETSGINDLLRADGIPNELCDGAAVCKFCKVFCGIRAKAVDPEYFKIHKSNKVFYKNHKKKLLVQLGLQDGEPSEPGPKKIHQVSHQSDNPTKITIKTTTLDVPAPEHRPSRKRKTKEFASPSSDARIQVVETGAGAGPEPGTSRSAAVMDSFDSKCAVTIQFDSNTKRLWQDLHYPYGNYTSFFRHLILLEKYWRNGDLTLSDSASQKASVYVKSVKNRIDAYEGRNKRSEADLSENTRPDLSVPSAPDMLHLPAQDDDDESEEAASSSSSSVVTGRSEEFNRRKETDSSTILKIPSFPMPTSSTPTPSSSATCTTTSAPSPGQKIRVRTDLMERLGLMARSEPNINEQPLNMSTSGASLPSFKIDDLMGPKPVSQSSYGSKQPSLIQMLNDPPKSKASSSSSKTGGPLLGNTSLVGPPSAKAHSNSQLFKGGSGGSGSSKSGDSGSSAIPLTFNNSIAEVLAATANKASKARDEEAYAAAVAAKPDVTITSKASKQSASSSHSRIQDMSSIFSEGELRALRAANVMSSVVSKPTPPPQHKTTQPSMHKSTASSTSTSASSSAKGHPLGDINKLLQSQNPGIAPHIVAQSVLPGSHASSTNSLLASSLNSSTSSNKQQPQQQQFPFQKIAPKPPGPFPASLRPVQVSKAPQGIQTVNKKSLNTVLDRLSGLKGPPTTGSHSTSSSAPPKMSLSSSLLQQLQAPPLASTKSLSSSSSQSRPATTSASSSRMSTSSSSGNNAAATAAALAFGQSLFGFPGQMVGQPMVQFPWQLMSGGLPGMSQMQTAAAIQEFMKLTSPSALSALMSATSPSSGAPAVPTSVASASPRVRPPPPLAHMGRPAGAAPGGTKPKQD